MAPMKMSFSQIESGSQSNNNKRKMREEDKQVIWKKHAYKRQRIAKGPKPEPKKSVDKIREPAPQMFKAVDPKVSSQQEVGEAPQRHSRQNFARSHSVNPELEKKSSQQTKDGIMALPKKMSFSQIESGNHSYRSKRKMSEEEKQEILKELAIKRQRIAKEMAITIEITKKLEKFSKSTLDQFWREYMKEKSS